VAKDKDPFDDLFEPFELDEGPPEPGSAPPPPPSPTQQSEPPTEPVPQVDCPSCGAANPAYNRHCEQCGARLTKEPLPVAPAPMVRATPGARALSVLAAAVLVVALVALVVNVFRGGGEAAVTTTVATSTTTTPPAVAQITPTDVSASSQLNETYGDANLIDGDLNTEWQVSHSNDLSVTFHFSQPVQIQYIEIYNIEDQNRFLANYRIKGYKITTDDLPGVPFQSTLKDTAGGPQRIDIVSLETTSLTLEVLSTYASQAVSGDPAFDELAVAEIKFWGSTGTS